MLRLSRCTPPALGIDEAGGQLARRQLWDFQRHGDDAFAYTVGIRFQTAIPVGPDGRRFSVVDTDDATIASIWLPTAPITLQQGKGRLVRMTNADGRGARNIGAVNGPLLFEPAVQSFDWSHSLRGSRFLKGYLGSPGS